MTGAPLTALSGSVRAERVRSLRHGPPPDKGMGACWAGTVAVSPWQGFAQHRRWHERGTVGAALIASVLPVGVG